MYQIGRVVPFQVDPEIVLRKRRVVKYRLLKKGSADDRPNYTLELRIIHVQKAAAVDKREAICLAIAERSFQNPIPPACIACKISKSSAQTCFVELELAGDWLLTLTIER